ncbi:MAG: hypothetical protein JST44_20615, partial [Cyanobacteria bacterium SZAS LIN-5]|nr:hypothetical protein [Cyanobacteria bacterium SZAS LIN-5]
MISQSHVPILRANFHYPCEFERIFDLNVAERLLNGYVQVVKQNVVFRHMLKNAVIRELQDMPSKRPKRRQKARETVYRRSWVRETVERDAQPKSDPKRMNFNWHTPRLEKIWQAAKRMDVSLEAFIRFAAYEKAVKVLAEPTPEVIEYEREKQWIDHRHSDWPTSRRYDLLPLNWKWRKHALDV